MKTRGEITDHAQHMKELEPTQCNLQQQRNFI
jgi:hypothetical protein